MTDALGYNNCVKCIGVGSVGYTCERLPENARPLFDAMATVCCVIEADNAMNLETVV